MKNRLLESFSCVPAELQDQLLSLFAFNNKKILLGFMT